MNNFDNGSNEVFLRGRQCRSLIYMKLIFPIRKNKVRNSLQLDTFIMHTDYSAVIASKGMYM